MMLEKYTINLSQDEMDMLKELFSKDYQFVEEFKSELNYILDNAVEHNKCEICENYRREKFLFEANGKYVCNICYGRLIKSKSESKDDNLFDVDNDDDYEKVDKGF